MSKTLAVATVDRLLHHAHVLLTAGTQAHTSPDDSPLHSRTRRTAGLVEMRASRLAPSQLALDELGASRPDRWLRRRSVLLLVRSEGMVLDPDTLASWGEQEPGQTGS
jgi:hypothetical protein